MIISDWSSTELFVVIFIGVVRIAGSHQNPKEDWPPCRNHPQDQALELGLIYKDVWEL